MSYSIFLLALDAESTADIEYIERGEIIARKFPGFETGSIIEENYTFAAHQNGCWFELVKKGSDPMLGAFDICDFEFNELETELLWRKGDMRYPLFFKSEELYRDFKQIINAVLDLSPKKTAIFLPRLQDEEYGDICGVVSQAELFALINGCRVLNNVCYVVKKTFDITDSLVRASELGLFTKSELSKTVGEISKHIEPASDNDPDEDWICFYSENGSAMLHRKLKILFTSAQLDISGVEFVKCGSRSVKEWSIDLDVINEKCPSFCWRTGCINPLCFSLDGLFYAAH